MRGTMAVMVLRPIAAAAHITGRRPSLIRRWYLQGHLTAACDTHTRAVLVDLTEATHLSNQRQTRHTTHPPPLTNTQN